MPGRGGQSPGRGGGKREGGGRGEAEQAVKASATTHKCGARAGAGGKPRGLGGPRGRADGASEGRRLPRRRPRPRRLGARVDRTPLLAAGVGRAGPGSRGGRPLRVQGFHSSGQPPAPPTPAASPGSPLVAPVRGRGGPPDRAPTRGVARPPPVLSAARRPSSTGGGGSGPGTDRDGPQVSPGSSSGRWRAVRVEIKTTETGGETMERRGRRNQRCRGGVGDGRDPQYNLRISPVLDFGLPPPPEVKGVCGVRAH